MTDSEIETFEQFWDYYVSEHRSKATRILHFIGTTAAVTCAATGIITRRPLLVVLALVCGYGPAWFSHFVIEKNSPATFTYPIWSLRADFVMWWKMVNGQMDAEVERVIAAEEARNAGTPPSGEHAVNMASEAVN